MFLLGDDVSDAMAFRALRDLRARDVTDGVAVAIQARAEVPAEVLAAADIVLASPVDATRFLSAIYQRRVHALVITLRPHELADVDVFYEHQADPELPRWRPFRRATAPTTSNHWTGGPRKSRGIVRAVLVDGAVAGNVLSWVDAETGRRPWATVRSPVLGPWRRHGGGRPYLERFPRASAIYLCGRADIKLAQRVLEKNGFVRDSFGAHYRQRRHRGVPVRP